MNEETDGTEVLGADDGGESAPGTTVRRRRSSRRRRGFLVAVWDWTRSVAIALALFLVVRTFLLEAFTIPTSSMEGTLLVGDFLLVNKAVYGAEIPGTGARTPALREPGRGEVVVFRPPHDPDRHYVKRVVGLPGDTVAMRDKKLLVNGRTEVEPYVEITDPGGDAVHPDMRWQVSHLRRDEERRNYRPTRDNWGPLVVPVGRFFVLGDNRDNSEDSRYWGFVPRESIEGHPWVVYYSFDPATAGGQSWLDHVRWSRIGGQIR